MAIFDLFSKRQRRLRGEVPDVYTYDKVPHQLRVQLVHVFRDLLGQPQGPYRPGTYEKPAEAYKLIVDILCREYGRLALGDDQYVERDYSIEVLNFFLETKDTEQALDVVELCAKVADRVTRNFEYLHENDPNQRIDAGIDEINARMREHGVGFQVESGELVRVDSDLLHSEAVKPALSLLRTKEFAGPRDEFLGAYEHYRKSNFEEALTDALKAFREYHEGDLRPEEVVVRRGCNRQEARERVPNQWAHRPVLGVAPRGPTGYPRERHRNRTKQAWRTRTR